MYSGTLIADLFELVEKAEKAAAKSQSSETAEAVLVGGEPFAGRDSKKAPGPACGDIV